jgi:hypothetical protein
MEPKEKLAEKLLILENKLTIAYNNYLNAEANHKIDIANTMANNTDMDLKDMGYTNKERRDSYVTMQTEKSKETLDNCKVRYDHLFRLRETIRERGETGLIILNKTDLDNLEKSTWVTDLFTGVVKNGKKTGKEN